MKRKILNIIGILLIAVCVTACGNNNKLTDIAKYFNESDTAKTYKEYGYDLNATVTKDTLTIESKVQDKKTTLTFKLNNNILSNDNIPNEDLLIALLVADSVGQKYGYKQGELSQNINAFPDKIREYTLDKEGFEFTFGDTNSLKIDLSKKVPLIDINQFYLAPEYFDMIRETKKENETGTQNGKSANIAYNISLGTEKSTIEIGQDEQLGDSAYKTILSALEVMYGKQVANQFQKVYPKFLNEKTTVDAFIIDTNYKREEQESSIFKGTKEVLVTIDNSRLK
jgi:hypothetical protein